jgi:hypothetical protein
MLSSSPPKLPHYYEGTVKADGMRISNTSYLCSMRSAIKLSMAALLLTTFSSTVIAQERGNASPFEVSQSLGKPAAGVSDLQFRDFYRMPVGPKGLEPSAKLFALDGKRVRIVGFMVHQEQPIAHRFLLAHLPVSMSEDEDGLADDLPPNIVFVHTPNVSEQPLKHLSGLLQFTGTLSLGAKEEIDGRVSTVRLLLDNDTSETLLKVSQVNTH